MRRTEKRETEEERETEEARACEAADADGHAFTDRAYAAYLEDCERNPE